MLQAALNPTKEQEKVRLICVCRSGRSLSCVYQVRRRVLSRAGPRLLDSRLLDSAESLSHFLAILHLLLLFGVVVVLLFASSSGSLAAQPDCRSSCLTSSFAFCLLSIISSPLAQPQPSWLPRDRHSLDIDRHTTSSLPQLYLTSTSPLLTTDRKSVV